MKQSILIALALVLMVVLAAPPTASAQPDVCNFHGTVIIDGTPTPDGTLVKAWIGGMVVKQTTTFTWGGDSVYTLNIEAIGWDYRGKTVSFTLGDSDTPANETGVWLAGVVRNLDLTGGETTVEVSMVLQGSSRPDPAGWEIPVTVKFFEPGSDPFTEPAVYEFNPTTSKDGDVAVCEVTGITPGTYDLTVVSEHTLMNVKRNVIISAPSTSVDMSTLLEGDWNGNLSIDWEDLGTVLLTYDKCQGDAGFDPAADFNRNGCIDWEDLGLVLINYDKASPVEVP